MSNRLTLVNGLIIDYLIDHGISIALDSLDALRYKCCLLALSPSESCTAFSLLRFITTFTDAAATNYYYYN